MVSPSWTTSRTILSHTANFNTCLMSLRSSKEGKATAWMSRLEAHPGRSSACRMSGEKAPCSRSHHTPTVQRFSQNTLCVFGPARKISKESLYAIATIVSPACCFGRIGCNLTLSFSAAPIKASVPMRAVNRQFQQEGCF